MRKTGLIIAASILLLLLVACAPMEVKEEAEEKEAPAKEPAAEKTKVDEKVVQTKKEAPKKETEKETTPAPMPKKTETKTEAPKEIPTELKELMEKADRKLTSMVYLYGSPESEGRFLDTYSVRADKMKVRLYEGNYYMRQDYFDTVYLDTTEKTATGRCENKKRCVFPDMDNTGRVFAANYDDYRRKTPYEWLQDITTPEILGPEIVDKRSALKIKYPKGDTEIKMWLDNTYGVPLQLKIIHPDDEEEMYQFTNLQFNTLKEEDVVPAFTEEQEMPAFNETA